MYRVCGVHFPKLHAEVDYVKLNFDIEIRLKKITTTVTQLSKEIQLFKNLLGLFLFHLVLLVLLSLHRLLLDSATLIIQKNNITHRRI